MPRILVRSTLSRQQKQIFDILTEKLGMNESELIRYSIFELARNLSLVTEKVHE